MAAGLGDRKHAAETSLGAVVPVPDSQVIRPSYIQEGTFAAVLLAAGVTFFVFAPDLVRGWAFAIPGTTDTALEPVFFPRLAATVLSLSALSVLVTMPFRHDALPLSLLTWRSLGKVALGFGGIAIYLASIGFVGFVVSSSFFIAIATWLSGYRRLVVVLPTALLVSIGLRLVFRYGLHVGLPTGLLF